MKKISRSALIIILAAVLLIAGTVAVFAALRDTAGTVTETLEKADVTCEVNGDYSVKNTGSVPALIRVRVVVNQEESGEIIPGDLPGYTVSSDWTRIGDYLYYNGILTEKDGGKDTTTAPISFGETPADNVETTVIAEAIQAAADAEKEGWDAAYSNGSWTS